MASLGTLLLASPTILLAWWAWQGSVAAGWGAGIVGVLLGIVVGIVGVGVGAPHYEQPAPQQHSAQRR